MSFNVFEHCVGKNNKDSSIKQSVLAIQYNYNHIEREEEAKDSEIVEAEATSKSSIVFFTGKKFEKKLSLETDL